MKVAERAQPYEMLPLLPLGSSVFSNAGVLLEEGKEAEPVVTVQTAVAERGTIQQIISAEAILFPARPGGHHSQNRRAGKNAFT